MYLKTRSNDNKGQQKMSIEDKREVLYRYVAGEKVSEIARAFSVSVGLVCQYARYAGVTRPRHVNAKNKAPREREWVTEARGLFAQGMTCKTIGSAVGKAEKTIMAEAARGKWARVAFSCYKCGAEVPPSKKRNSADRRVCTACELQRNREKAAKQRWKRRSCDRDDQTLTNDVVRALFAKAKQCPYCWHPMKSQDKSLDHMEPLSRGGWHSVSNVLVCCLRCNSRKKDTPWTEWLSMIPEACERAIREKIT